MDRCSDKGYCHLTKIMRKEMKEIDCCIITRFSIIDINRNACMYNWIHACCMQTFIMIRWVVKTQKPTIFPYIKYIIKYIKI